MSRYGHEFYKEYGVGKFGLHKAFRVVHEEEGARIVPIRNIAHVALDDFFREHPYEIVHCHLNYKSGVVLAAAKKAGIPIRVAHAHTAGMSAGFSKLARIVMKPLIPLTATHCFACGKTAGDAIFSGMPYELIPNAIDAEALRFGAQTRQRMRGELELGEAFTVIHVGRFGGEKNHAFLLDTFAEVLKTEPGAKLVLAGDGPLRTEMEQKAAMLSEGSVRFLGVRKDVPDLLQAADVFAFPSIFEGLPVTMIEAQASGLPCVKSDTVTDECIVTDLVTSLPIDDPKPWAAAILAKRDMPRIDRLTEIQASGYDITAAAEKLTRFYLNGEIL